MIPYENCLILASVFFYLTTKILSAFSNSIMYKKSDLSSIPELDVEEEPDRKWVPKKKHEVLKAKYKCLKKLFQIYDASVIGILPEAVPDTEEEKGIRRRKRSYRTKSDACAGTNEISSGDNTISEYENEHSSVATGINDLTIDQSCTTTQIDKTDKFDKFAETVTFSDKFDSRCQLKNCHCQRLEQLNSEMQEKLYKDRLKAYAHYAQPYNMRLEKRKLTRFQWFLQRLFGTRPESTLRRGFDNQLYAASDPLLTNKEKRRRRGLRFRRIRGRTKKVHSESALKDLRNPSILSYIQSVQKYCLMDTTPRKCPIPGCGMVSYGIINYNDHLNLCHFKDRKHTCMYCHEGFETEHEKIQHENEHIGISKLGTNMSTFSTGLYIPDGMFNAGYLSNRGYMPEIFSANGPNMTQCGTNMIQNGSNVTHDGPNMTQNEPNMTHDVTNIATYKIASNTQTDPEAKIPEEKLKKIVSFFEKMNDPERILSGIKKNRYSDTNLSKKDDSGSTGCSGSGSGSATERSDQTNSEKSQTNSCCNLSRCRECKLPSSANSDISASKFLNAPYCCRYCGESFTCRRQLNKHMGSEHPARYPKYHSCAGILRCADNFMRRSATVTLSQRQHSLKRVGTASSISGATRDVSDGTRDKSDASLTCDPSTNIVYYSSAESLGAESVTKIHSYHWQPATAIIRV